MIESLIIIRDDGFSFIWIPLDDCERRWVYVIRKKLCEEVGWLKVDEIVVALSDPSQYDGFVGGMGDGKCGTAPSICVQL